MTGRTRHTMPRYAVAGCALISLLISLGGGGGGVSVGLESVVVDAPSEVGLGVLLLKLDLDPLLSFT
jgi:hypothetical protein